MAKLKIRAKEIFNGDVRWISLVKRGANRLPIKIIKSEEDIDMGIDLGSMLFSKKDGEAAVPASDEMTVAAVVIRKGPDMGKLIGQVKALGFKIDATQEDDDALILKQDGWEKDEGTMVPVRLNEDIGVIMGNAKKFFDPFSDSMSFIENVGAKGFFPGVQMANEALISTTMGIMRNTEDRKDAVSLIEKALDDHKQFVMGLTKSLPKVAFKLEELDRLSLTEKGDCADCGDGGTSAKLETPEERAANEGYDHTGCPPGQTRGDDGNCMEITVGAEENAAVVEDPTSSDAAINPAVLKAQKALAEAQAQAQKSPGNPDENNANLSPRGDCPEGQHLVDGRCVPLETGATSEAPPPVGTGAGQLGAETGEMLKAFGKVTDALRAITDGLAGLTGKVEKLEKDAGKSQDRLNSVEKAAEAATVAVEGTALVGSIVQPEDLDGIHADRSRSKEDGKNGVRKGFWGGTEMEKMFSPEYVADLKQ